MRTLGEIGQFTWAVLMRWQALATGGIVTAILLVLERVFDMPLARRDFILVVIVCFFLAAFFLAWRDENRKVQMSEQTVSELQARLEAKPHITLDATASAAHDQTLPVVSVPGNVHVETRFFKFIGVHTTHLAHNCLVKIN